MSRITVDYSGMPGNAKEYSPDEMREKLKTLKYEKENTGGHFQPNANCCCPEELEFHFFCSNVIVLNENSDCPDLLRK